MIYRESITRLD